MKITYDDLTEFAEIRLRCEYTRQRSMCKYCPFYDRCDVDDNENLHTMCCEILSMIPKENNNEITKNF
jgi:MoaA/NifB/PqqE/SkfB family radical SAM enzyme